MGGKGTLARAAEQREATRRVQEYAREEIKRHNSEQKCLKAVSADMERDDFRRKAREFRERNAELSVLQNMYEADKAKELATMRAQDEERISATLAEKQRQEQKKQKEIQRLREESAELRELAEKIRTAKVSKERALQVQEKAMLAEQEREHQRQFDDMMTDLAAAAEQRHREEQQRVKEGKIEAKHVLQQQMAERLEAAKLASAECERERALVDEVVRRLAEEDMLSAGQRRAKQEETKQYIAQFLQQQAEARQRQQQEREQEERKIQAYWEHVRDREAAEASAAAQRQEVADRIYERLKREAEAVAAAREEEEELMNLVRREEAEARSRQADAARAARAAALREEVRAANEAQRAARAAREAAMRLEEEAERRALMERFAEDERLEQMNAAKRRMREQEHKREVERLLAVKRDMFEKQRAAEEAEQQARLAEKEREAALLEEERRRLLAEAASLQEYLPKGVLRDQRDAQLMRSLAPGR